MQMLVLAGGFGSRLRSIVSDVPKPLAPINNKPFLYFQIQFWVSQGVNSFIFLLYYKADMIERFLFEQCEELLSGCEVRTIRESVPLDTGGAIACAVNQFHISNDFIVTNADTWLTSGVKELKDVGSDAVAVIYQGCCRRYGQVLTDRDSNIVEFVEKKESVTGGWVNAGMYLLNYSHFKQWDGKPFSLERSFFPNLIKTRRLRAVKINSDFIDIGIPEDYLRFCNNFLAS